MNILVLMTCLLWGADTQTPSLQQISVIKSDDKIESIEVSFFPGKGSPSKAASYALRFSDLRGRIDPQKTDPKAYPPEKRGPTSAEVKAGKDENTFVVIIDCIEGSNVYAGTSVKKIGPLTYEDDSILIPIELKRPVTQDKEFDVIAVSVKLWYVYAVMHTEEEWIDFHKKRPLESPLKVGMEPVLTESPSKRTYRAPRDRSVPYVLKN